MSSTRAGYENEQGVSGSSRSTPRPSPLDIEIHPVENPVPENRQNPSASSNQKRKPPNDNLQPKAKRRRTIKQCEEYRHLLNDIIQDVSTQSNIHEEEEAPLPASQIGASFWTSEEKDVFFRALPVLGKDNVTGIASRIRTKSALEVTLYVQLLRRAMVDRYLNKRNLQLLGIMDMPAACEISQDCCDRLDQEAALLESRQSQEESGRETRKWNDLWLLTPEIGSWVESKLDEGIQGENEVVNRQPAARLLKLDSWLELSERIFMNAAPPRDDENWHSISETEEPPSIRSTAFADLANLTVSITERLVQATLFQAQSRCRAIDSRHFARGYSVKVRDVHSACQVLGMEQNSRRFWTYAARRCGLNVYKQVSDMTSKSTEVLPMTYDEIEQILVEGKSKADNSARETGEGIDKAATQPNSNNSRMTSLERSRTTATASPANGNSPTETSSSSLESDSPDSSIVVSENDIDKSYSREARGLAKRRARHELHRAQDAYMEALDLRNSSVEEHRLWKMLGQEMPSIRPEEEVELPKPPPLRERKKAQDLVDWRERTEYWSEWETLKVPIGEEMLLRAPIRRRTKSSKAGNTVAERISSGDDEPEDAADSDDDGGDDSGDTRSEMDISQEDNAMSFVSEGNELANGDDDDDDVAAAGSDTSEDAGDSEDVAGAQDK